MYQLVSLLSVPFELPNEILLQRTAKSATNVAKPMLYNVYTDAFFVMRFFLSHFFSSNPSAFDPRFCNLFAVCNFF